MTKEERIQHAKEWVEYTREKYAEETKDSIARTKVYGPGGWRLRSEASAFRNQSKLVATDSVSCLFDYASKEDGKICLFNFASYKNPGGFFLGGSPAQEESLCHESNLYDVLSSFEGTYYTWNRNNLNRAMYKDRALYSPDIVFEHNGQVMKCDVLTCAAPNYGTAARWQGMSIPENAMHVYDRMEFIGNILEENNVKVFICGAWGCGVFKQPASGMCQAITWVLGRKFDIPIIYHPIPDEHSNNFQLFLRELKRIHEAEERRKHGSYNGTGAI